MKAVLALVVTCTVLVPGMVTTAQAAAARASRVSVSYVPPKNPAHLPIYEQLKQLRFLEKLQQFLTPFRLPRALLVKVEGCDGDANAFYEYNVITVCYEYIDQLWKTVPADTKTAGVTPIDAIVGPLFDTCLHGYAAADAAARSGHQRDLPLQPELHPFNPPHAQRRRCAATLSHLPKRKGPIRQAGIRSTLLAHRLRAALQGVGKRAQSIAHLQAGEFEVPGAGIAGATLHA